MATAGNQHTVSPKVPDHTLIRRIGEGSYGDVWIARNDVTGGLRAVKVVHRLRFDSDRPYDREYEGIVRFEPISRKHPSLVDILHVGRNDAEGCFYYVMELSDPMPIDDAMDRSPDGIDPATYQPWTLESDLRRRGRITSAECVRLGLALSEGLVFLHQHGLVHRDIKPANIIFVDGTPRLADVGLIAQTGSARSFVGTEGYIPPEGPGKPTADIYALGMVLYELATGQDRHEFPDLPDEPPSDPLFRELNLVVLRACDPKPAKRHPSAQELRHELRAIDKGGSLVVRRGSRAVLLTLLCLLCLLVVFGSRDARPEPFPRLHRIRALPLPVAFREAAIAVGDFDADQEADVVIVEKNRLLVADGSGLIHGQWQPANVGAAGLELGPLIDVDGDGRDDVFVNWRRGAKLHAALVSQHFQERRRFNAVGVLRETPAGMVGDSHLATRHVQDLDGDGTSELLASINTGFSGQSRAVVCFDYPSGRELWRYPVAAFPERMVLLDLEGDGKLEVLLGSYAVNNGSQLPDGTDDRHSYLYALRHDGSLLWRREMGGVYTGCQPIATERSGAAESGVIAMVFGHRAPRAAENEDEVGQLLRLDSLGRTVAGFSLGATVLDARVLPRRRGEISVLVTDRTGRLLVLNDQLRLQQVRRVVAPRFADVDLRLQSVADLNGDGQEELALTSSQIANITPFSPGHPGEPPDIRHYHHNEIIILGADLDVIVRHQVARLWKKNPGLRIFAANFEGDSAAEILCVENKATLLRLVGWEGAGESAPGPVDAGASRKSNARTGVHSRSLMAGQAPDWRVRQILSVAYQGAPANIPDSAEPPRCQFEVLASSGGDNRFRRLGNGESLRSRKDRYVIAAKPWTQGWLYVFQIDAAGKVDWLFPRNEVTGISSGSNPVVAGKVIRMPESSTAALYLDDTAGIEHIYTVFSSSPFPDLERELMAIRRQEPLSGIRTVAAPFGMRMRGVGGVVSADATDLVSELFHNPEAPASVSSVSASKIYRGSGPILVVERWFHHVEAAGALQTKSKL